jgi:hypothetical protein
MRGHPRELLDRLGEAIESVATAHLSVDVAEHLPCAQQKMYPSIACTGRVDRPADRLSPTVR